MKPLSPHNESGFMKCQWLCSVAHRGVNFGVFRRFSEGRTRRHRLMVQNRGVARGQPKGAIAAP